LRAVIQRVARAAVSVDGTVGGSVGPGLLVFLGVGREDDAETARRLAKKVAALRIFPDDADRMNRSVRDVGGEVLVVSQFTLYADCRHGNRPAFTAAAPPDTAEALYRCFVEALEELGLSVATGVFGARMLVQIDNDGPVTIVLDTRE